MPELIAGLVLCVILVVAIYVGVRPRRRPSPAPAFGPSPVVGGQVSVRLPIDDADPEAPATKRLVHGAAQRAFAVAPTATTVVVCSRKGAELGREEREIVSNPRPFVDAPLALRERIPTHLANGAHAPDYVRFSEGREERRRPLAEHLDLPPEVNDEIHDPDDPVDVVAAILHAGGIDDVRDGNVIRCGDRAVIVLRSAPWDAVDAAHLNAAYFQFLDSGARSGVVVTPGALHAYELRRREALAPELKHAGMSGIQRMADAVAVGADPLDLVAGF
ncbi:MAG: hypothetical protein WD826_02120 [Actinomycetota bacterium]